MIRQSCRFVSQTLAKTLESPKLTAKIQTANAAAIRYLSSISSQTDMIISNPEKKNFSWAVIGPHRSVGALREFHSSQVRCRKTKRQPTYEADEEGIEDIDEDELMKGDKLLKVRLSSDRVDAVLKVGLNMSRNKIDKALYGDLVRINGERPTKKSHLISEGDEIDFVVRYSPSNEAFLEVHRLKILHLGSYSRLESEDSDDEAKMPAKILRTRNLLVENYRKNPIKGNIDTI